MLSGKTCKNDRALCWNLDPRAPKYKSGSLPTWQRCGATRPSCCPELRTIISGTMIIGNCEILAASVFFSPLCVSYFTSSFSDLHRLHLALFHLHIILRITFLCLHTIWIQIKFSNENILLWDLKISELCWRKEICPRASYGGVWETECTALPVLETSRTR